MTKENQSEEITTVGGRLKSGPGGSYAEFIQAPRFEIDRIEKFDAILYTHKAWTYMLMKQGVLTEDEASLIFNALTELKTNGHEALGPYQSDLEDLYMHVEKYLSSKINSDIVGKINYGRTRPEPFNRLVGRKELLNLIDEIIHFYSKIMKKALAHMEMVMPGYTHMQQAQPMTVGHYLIAVVDICDRAIKVVEIAYDFMNRNSLGTGALAGTHMLIDRELVSEIMGFDGLVENAYDAVSSADHFIYAASASAGIAASLSRVAQDFNMWSMAEFGIVHVGDEFAATSSMMPQKRNAVCWEFIRARTAKVIGASMDVLSIVHNTYFEDVCDICIEISEPSWRSIETTCGSLRLLGDAIQSVEFIKEKMDALINHGFSTVSELAELIRKKSNRPYRAVHKLIGRIVTKVIEEGKTASDIDAGIIKNEAKKMNFPDIDISEEEVKRALDPYEFILKHNSIGGTSPESGRRMHQKRTEKLEIHKKNQTMRQDRLKNSENKLNELISAVTKINM